MKTLKATLLLLTLAVTHPCCSSPCLSPCGRRIILKNILTASTIRSPFPKAEKRSLTCSFLALL